MDKHNTIMIAPEFVEEMKHLTINSKLDNTIMDDSESDEEEIIWNPSPTTAETIASMWIFHDFYIPEEKRTMTKSEINQSYSLLDIWMDDIIRDISEEAKEKENLLFEK